MYVAIDLETTGLDRDRCQVIEICAIKEGPGEIKNLKRYHRLVKHPAYYIEPGAYKMNKERLDVLLGGAPSDIPIVDVSQVMTDLNIFFGASRTVLAGKNVGSFDLQFLLKMPGSMFMYHHRCIDVGTLYWNGKGVPPSLEECCGWKVAHNAQDDAEAVITLIRRKYGLHPNREPFLWP